MTFVTAAKKAAKRSEFTHGDMRGLILINSNFVEVTGATQDKKLSNRLLATIVSNLAYYGYAPSRELYERLSTLSREDAETVWSNLEPLLKRITGADKKMGDFVVYKNFPDEALDMTQAEYWIKQILMYLGMSHDLFTEEEKERPSCVFEDIKPKVLHLAKDNTLQNIGETLFKAPARWTKEQFAYAKYLVTKAGVVCDPSNIVFKENFASLVQVLIESDADISIRSATDVLRLAVAMSDGDVSMREKSKFRVFTRRERRFLLKNLNGASSLEEDMARDTEKWKRLMKYLHPNDYRKSFPKVCKAYDKLYNRKVKSFNAQFEALYKEADEKVLELLSKRPGEFMRRLHQVVSLFDEAAVEAFIKVLPKLKTVQLLKIAKYVETINLRFFRTFAPKGNWTKVQLVENNRSFPEKLANRLIEAIETEVAKRVSAVHPSVNLSPDTKMIKLQTNDADVLPYGRGTEFPIPDNIKFIRSASYWEQLYAYGSSWFDNSWNFFGESWDYMGSCCWAHTQYYCGHDVSHGSSYRRGTRDDIGAVFSGDPVNTPGMKGKACQMIDLYLDKLEAAGVRYAVWSVLCYSGVPFDQAKDVFAAMLWGEDASAGALFEPSRCQMAFPLRGKTKTKFICYLDLKERKVVFMDANLRGTVRDAHQNGPMLTKMMPAYVEYMATVPSVHDLFKGVPQDEAGTPVQYTDADVEIKDGKKAYVFRPQNEENQFEQLNLNELL